jgi:hypothetical protein
MPTYAPQDMAYILRMTKPSGKMTKEEMDLVQNIGQAVAPMGARPVNMPAMDVNSVVRPNEMPQYSDPNSVLRAGETSMAIPQKQPMNRLAAIQAAANAQLAGEGEAANPNMANIAKYFQGR